MPNLITPELYILFNKVLLVTIVTLSLWFGIWVLMADRRSYVNRLFFILSVFFCLWPTFGYLTFFTREAEMSHFWVRWAYASTSLFTIALYLFFAYFFGEEKRFRFFKVFVWIGGLLHVGLSFLTNSIVQKIEVQEAVGIKPVFGIGAYTFYTWVFIVFIFILFRFYKNFLIASKEEKRKIQYFFVGTIIFILLATVFDIIIPVWKGDYSLHQFGNYSGIFFLGFTAYAIVKRELFGIRVILTDLLVGMMGMVLFVIPFLVSAIWLKALLFVVFFFFCIISYLLIRYTHREAKQKELLEQKVKERTKEIEKRKADLEKFYKLLVGRELKMVELKKKIKKGEKEIKEMEEKTKEEK